MTRLVVLDTAPPASLFDEGAIFSRQVSASSIAALYNAMAAAVNQDPQDALGWEEVYGADYPLTAADVPVITNGITRVRYLSAFTAYAIDLYQPGIGWVEEGRVTVWSDDNGTVTQHGNLVSAAVVEWTVERAVVRVSTTAQVGAIVYRMDTYITVQRGWSAPRFECYPSPNPAGSALGAHVRFAPYTTLDPFQAIIGKSPFTIYQGDVGVAWPGGYDDWTAANSEPWAALIGADRTMVMKPVRAAARVRRYDDVAAYGNVRKAIAICADYGTAQAGYVSTRLGFAPESRMLDAEAYMNAGGTRTIVADAAASDGGAVNDTQTAATANTILVSNAQLNALGLRTGKYGVWVQVRVTTAGDTMTIAGGFQGAGNSTGGLSPTTTSSTFVWVYLGESTLADLTTGSFYLNIWRSAGVGTTGVRIDRFLLVPHEQRSPGPNAATASVQPAWDGVRDIAAANLYDARAVPTLTAR